MDESQVSESVARDGKPSGFLDQVRAGRFLLDGGMGSSLLARGELKPREIALASLRHPQWVRHIHREFLRAGSRWVQSNTFGANRIALRACGAEASVAHLNGRAVELARDAAQEFPGTFVAGNLGSAGLWSESRSHPGESELAACYREQGEALQESGVDLFSLETLAGEQEACLAIEALRSLGELPIVACLTFEGHAGRFTTLAGEPVAPVLQAMHAAGADLVGVNCAGGSREVLELVRSLAGGPAMPLLAKPNAGLPGQEPQSPAHFACDMQQAVEAGVLAVGGCCGADGRFIDALRSALCLPKPAQDRSSEH